MAKVATHNFKKGKIIMIFRTNKITNYTKIDNRYLEDKNIKYKDEKIININDVKIKGIHNYENIMCLIAIQKIFNISNDVIKDYLSIFGGVEHRIEFVTSVNGRLFYNDSKATNTESTIVALKSFENNIILLLGGLDRGHSFDELEEFLKNTKYNNISCFLKKMMEF